MRQRSFIPDRTCYFPKSHLERLCLLQIAAHVPLSITSVPERAMKNPFLNNSTVAIAIQTKHHIGCVNRLRKPTLTSLASKQKFVVRCSANTAAPAALNADNGLILTLIANEADRTKVANK
jgi:hypothetical protein